MTKSTIISRRTLLQASFSLALSPAFAITDVESAPIEVRVYSSLLDAERDDISAQIKRLHVQFRAPNFAVPRTLVGGAHYRRVDLADLVGYPQQSYFRSADRFTLEGKRDDVAGGYWILDEQEPLVSVFGAVGDELTDDSQAIQASLDWLSLSQGRTIVFDGGKRFRLASGVSVDFSKLNAAGSIIMRGSIKPDAGIGRALSISNAREGEFVLRVFGGGQLADYTKPNPPGADEAFVLRAMRGSTVEAYGGDYRGRVLRILKSLPDEYPTSGLKITRIYTDETAGITADEKTRQAAGAGQAFYIDTYSSAFGEILSAITFWDHYGPVIENTGDVTIHSLEGTWRGNSGMAILGGISCWLHSIKLGNESKRIDLLTLSDSATRSCQNIYIGLLFTVGGKRGLLAQNVGVSPGQGLVVDAMFSRLNGERGLVLQDCSEFDVGFYSYADEIALELGGECVNGQVNVQITASKKQAIIIGAACSEIDFAGTVRNGNMDRADGISLIELNSRGPVNFNNMSLSSSNVEYLYDFPDHNNVTLNGGRIVSSKASTMLSNPPKYAKNVRGINDGCLGAPCHE